MATTHFVDLSPATPIVAAWLNDVNDTTYTTVPDVLTSLGLTADALARAGQIATSLGTFRVADSVAAAEAMLKADSAHVFVTGYYSPHDGGGGPYTCDLADTTTPRNGGTVLLTVDGGRLKLSHLGSVTLRQFGAKGDNATDDSAAILAAVGCGVSTIKVTPGFYKCSQTIPISQSGIWLQGDGQFASLIIATNTNKPLVQVTAGYYGVRVSGMTLDRTGTAIGGGNGLDTDLGDVEQCVFWDLRIQNHYNGFNLGPTNFGTIKDCLLQFNQNNGLQAGSVGTNGTLQWYMSNVLSQSNGADGYLFLANAGPAQCTLGTMENCFCYANSGLGLAFVGLAAVPMHGVRIIGGFYGQDGNHEIYLDTYGTQHCIRDTFMELCGTSPTGPAGTTPASHAGNGLYATNNNGTLELSGCHVNGNSANGVLSGAAHTAVSGGNYTNNGQANTAGARNGIQQVGGSGGTLIVNGAQSGNTAGTSQTYGVVGDDGMKTSIIGCDLMGNVTGPYGANTNAGNLTSVGNLPGWTNQFTNGVAVGNPVGGASPGAVNASVGIYLNNNAYANP